MQFSDPNRMPGGLRGGRSARVGNWRAGRVRETVWVRRAWRKGNEKEAQVVPGVGITSSTLRILLARSGRGTAGRRRRAQGEGREFRQRQEIRPVGFEMQNKEKKKRVLDRQNLKTHKKRCVVIL